MTADQAVAPAHLMFSNQSVDATSYKWFVNDSLVGESKELEFDLVSSGRHNIKLEARDGKKTSVHKQEIILNAPVNCQVLLQTTAGNMLLELSEKTPRHSANFEKMVERGFYDGVIFHRVIKGFMIQGGNEELRSTPWKAPIPEELESEIRDDMIHVRGALAAARMPDNINPNRKSSSTQFYIVEGSAVSEIRLENASAEQLIDYTEAQKNAYINEGGAPQLDGAYTVFGRLVQGFDVLDRIASVDTDKYNKPLEDIRIIKAQVIK